MKTLLSSLAAVLLLLPQSALAAGRPAPFGDIARFDTTAKGADTTVLHTGAGFELAIHDKPAIQSLANGAVSVTRQPTFTLMSRDDKGRQTLSNEVAMYIQPEMRALNSDGSASGSLELGPEQKVSLREVHDLTGASLADGRDGPSALLTGKLPQAVSVEVSPANQTGRAVTGWRLSLVPDASKKASVPATISADDRYGARYSVPATPASFQ